MGYSGLQPALIAISLTSKVDRADGSRATGTWNTGVRLLHTSLALTDVAAATVRIHQALRATASDGVGVGDETRLTSTDSVTRPGQSTVGSGTTRGWVAGLQTVNSKPFSSHLTINLHRAPQHTSDSDR